MTYRIKEEDVQGKLDQIESQVEKLKTDLENQDEQARIRLATILTELEKRLVSVKVDFIEFKSEAGEVWKDTQEALADATLALERDFQQVRGNFQN